MGWSIGYLRDLVENNYGRYDAEILNSVEEMTRELPSLTLIAFIIIAVLPVLVGNEAGKLVGDAMEDRFLRNQVHRFTKG